MGSFLSRFGAQFPTFNHFVAAIFAPTPFPSLAPTSFPSPIPVYPPYYEPSLAPSPIPTALQEIEPTVDKKEPSYNEADVPSFSPTITPSELIAYDVTSIEGSVYNQADLPSAFPTMTPSTVPSSSPSSLSSVVPTSSGTYDPSDVGFRIIVDSGCSSEEGTSIQEFLLDQVTSTQKLRKRKLWSYLFRGTCSWMCASWPVGRCYMLHVNCSFYYRRDRRNRRLLSGSSGSPTDEQLTSYSEDDSDPELSARFLPQEVCRQFNTKMNSMLSNARDSLTLSDQCSRVLTSAHIDCFEPTS